MFVIKNGCGLLGHGTLKSPVSPEWTDELSLFFACWYKFRKTNSYFNKFWVFVVNNVCGRLGHGTLKSAVCQEWIGELSWFFACWYKFRKAKSYFNNYWVCMVKCWRYFLGHETLNIRCISRMIWWLELFCTLVVMLLFLVGPLILLHGFDF